MKNHIDSGAPAPPPHEKPTLAASTYKNTTIDKLQEMELDDWSQYLQELIPKGIPDQQPKELAEDGFPQVYSLIAVFLINQIGDAVGEPKIVDLSAVENHDDLRSLTGFDWIPNRSQDWRHTTKEY